MNVAALVAQVRKAVLGGKPLKARLLVIKLHSIPDEQVRSSLATAELWLWQVIARYLLNDIEDVETPLSGFRLYGGDPAEAIEITLEVAGQYAKKGRVEEARRLRAALKWWTVWAEDAKLQQHLLDFTICAAIKEWDDAINHMQEAQAICEARQRDGKAVDMEFLLSCRLGLIAAAGMMGLHDLARETCQKVEKFIARNGEVTLTRQTKLVMKAACRSRFATWCATRF